MKYASSLTGTGESKAIWREVLPLLIDALQGQPGFYIQECTNFSENDPWKQLEVLQNKSKRGLIENSLWAIWQVVVVVVEVAAVSNATFVMLILDTLLPADQPMLCFLG